MRRSVGVNYVLKSQEKDESMKAVGTALHADRKRQLHECCRILRTKLSEYARKHKNDIDRTPELREQFREMCSRLGVDFLTTQKSLFSELFSDVGQFYFELAVQVIEHCIASRNQNGGLFPMKELVRRLSLSRPEQRITAKDVTFCLQKLSILGPGYIVREIGCTSFVMYDGAQDLNTDATTILSLCQTAHHSSITAADVLERTSWASHRVECALEILLKSGIAWLEMTRSTPDCEKDEHLHYWFPSLLM